MSDAVLPAARRRLSTSLTLFYGFGSVAYGVKDAAFGTFLMLYYNQVLGVHSFTVGLVVMAALVLDAFVDPLVGILSDRTRGRWGRRHPWMYFSALPIVVGWLMLWNPPALSEGWRLVWLFVTAVIVRSAVSCFEVPSQALTPELTPDYDERTRITAYRYLFGWLGGLLVVVLAYGVFLTATQQYPNGILNVSGYHKLSLVTAGMMLLAILVSALGTHREIARLPQAAAASQSFGETLHELWTAMRNRGFQILILAGVCVYTNQGIGYALANYFYGYVWQFRGLTQQLVPLALLVGVAIAFALAPRIARTTTKPKAAFRFVVAAAFLHTLPYWLRFAGLLPPPGSPWQAPVLYAIFATATVMSVSAFILGASMMADVVENSQVTTGRRNEGVFFAGSFFVQKCTTGLGFFGAGAMLGLAGFPAQAVPGKVPVAVLDRLTLQFAVLYVILSLIAAFLFTRFPFGRAEHEAGLAQISAAAEREGTPHVP